MKKVFYDTGDNKELDDQNKTKYTELQTEWKGIEHVSKQYYSKGISQKYYKNSKLKNDVKSLHKKRVNI